MDPITAAIVAVVSAVATGAIGGLTEASKTAITDAYNKLKALLSKKFGGESDVVHAVNEVEAKPNSAGQDFGQNGAGVTFWCEQDLVKGTSMGQTEKRMSLLKSEQGGLLCTTITHLPQHEPALRVGMPVCAW